MLLGNTVSANFIDSVQDPIIMDSININYSPSGPLAGAGASEMTPTSRRPSVPPSHEEVAAMKRMLESLRRFSHIWQVPPQPRQQGGKKGRPIKISTTEWQTIALETTGNPDNVKLVKGWWAKIKKAISYRIDLATIKRTISTDTLLVDPQASLARMYDLHPYEFWKHAEFLTKYLICQGELNVDIDGIYTEMEQNEQQVPVSVQRQPVPEYNVLLSGVTGYQPQTPYRQLPRILRRGASGNGGIANAYEELRVPPEQSQDNGNADGTSAEATIAAERNGDPLLASQTISATMDEIKEEPLDQDDYSTEIPQHGHLAFEYTTAATCHIDDVKRETSDRKRNPLEHFFPQNAGSDPRPAEYYGITQEEMDKRINLFQNFSGFFGEMLMTKSEEEVRKFMRAFQVASGAVNTLVDGQGAPLGQIDLFIEKKLQELNLN